MSIRRVTCPGCGTQANVPVAMANVKCPSCATVWNVSNPSPAKSTANDDGNSVGSQRSSTKPKNKDGVNAVMIGGLVAGGMMLFTMVGVVIVIVNREPKPSAASADAEIEDTIKSATPEPYRVIRVPEPTRKRIYDDYRKVARSTTEKRLMIPQGNVRQAFEGTLDSLYERELRRFAALHDVTVDDIKEVIKEGDAKGWDSSRRSNAIRDGKRVYPKEMREQ